MVRYLGIRTIRSVSIAIALLGAAVAPALAAKPMVLHLKWQRVLAEGGVVSNSRYVLLLPPAAPFTLLDQQTRQRRAISPPNCPSFPEPMFGGGWILFRCSDRSFNPPVELYSLKTERWRTITLSPKPGCKKTITSIDCIVDAVGARWLKIDAKDCPGKACGDTFWLQSIKTGMVRRDRVYAGGHLRDDLDAPSGEGRLCSPLRFPTVIADYTGQREPGSLVFLGRFAVVNGSRLRECGSHVNIPVDGSPVLGTERDLIWPGRVGPVGLHLPTLRRFMIAQPRKVSGTVAALTLHTVYVSGQNGVWAATLPTAG